jgi:hypothetical protein
MPHSYTDMALPRHGGGVADQLSEQVSETLYPPARLGLPPHGRRLRHDVVAVGGIKDDRVRHSRVVGDDAVDRLPQRSAERHEL